NSILPLLLLLCYGPALPHPSLFFFNDTAPPEIYTLSLHDALPIFAGDRGSEVGFDRGGAPDPGHVRRGQRRARLHGTERRDQERPAARDPGHLRAEGHDLERPEVVTEADRHSIAWADGIGARWQRRRQDRRDRVVRRAR